jgi:hypothetical protein
MESDEVKEGTDLSLLFLHRQGLAGRPWYAGSPDLPFAGSSRRSGRFPALPYPPLEQMGFAFLRFNCASTGSVSRFRFPGGL